MARSAATDLTTFLRDQAGEYLRGAIHYSADGYEVLYLRDDLADAYSDAELRELCAFYREENDRRDGDEPFDLGNHHCEVNLYDGMIQFHFTQGDTVGTVITMEPEAGRDIVRFITECLGTLHESTPHEIPESPTWVRNDRRRPAE